ncbi:MAG TPA: methylated-DNA--[protein]-cysteine S-methyltransferase, partial [Longimicrobiales bacterium]|nr:methylated-DNA--[protein]-cysteine S-methyltransferase [Longimicrobiales bacterium]
RASNAAPARNTGAINAKPDDTERRPMIDIVHYRFEPGPLGIVLLASRGGALVRLDLIDDERDVAIRRDWRPDDGRLEHAAVQLREYFNGERTTFDLDLSLEGTPFQQKVWAALREIPYGETISYGDLAARLGRPGAARAVGNANGRNPVAIIVPCHRVIAAGGGLGGYSAGLERKRFLLDLEARVRAGRIAIAA